jgi:hypothetical protein
MADLVAVMKRVWAGENVTDSVVPVGPAPLQNEGPSLLVGTMGGSPNPFWRHRSGSRSATVAKRALKFTDICAAT